jgi:hypothetical protein
MTPYVTGRPGLDLDTSVLAAAGERLADLDSYQFKIVVRSVNVPSFSETGMDLTITSTIVRRPTAAAHVLMVGKVEPMKGTYEVVSIGDRAWIRGQPTGGKWVASPASEGQSFMESMEQFNPASLYKTLGSELIDKLTKVGPEERNATPTVHYTIPPAALAKMEADAELKGQWAFDVWIAQEDPYLVAMEMHGQGVDSKGRPGELLISIENSHLNDPANVIEPPTE